jgi:F-type H+-transporting ATPase subunit gamma
VTDRLSDVTARLAGIRQLGAVVNAMTGIAAARARQAREQIAAADRYAAALRLSLAQAMTLVEPGPEPVAAAGVRAGTALLVFCAEQGFAGAFSERVLQTLAQDPASARMLLIGARGGPVAAALGIRPIWQAAMPSHAPGIPKLATRVTQALFGFIAQGLVDRLEVVLTDWERGAAVIRRRRIFPVDLPSQALASPPPLTNLDGMALIEALSGDYLHAQVCQMALHAFAAENEARMAAMAAARSQIEREAEVYQALERRVRQEAITAEIIELSVR